MRHLLLGFMPGLLLCGCGAGDFFDRSDVKNVFGDDNRQELSATSYPGKAIGRLDGGCSGVMIGRDLAVTAAHCVYNTEASSLRDDVQYFRAGYRDGESFAQAWIEAVWFGSTTPVENRRDDWAILQLAEPIGDDTGWFGIADVDLSAALPYTVNLAGYASDRMQGERAFWHQGCYIHKVDDQGRHLHDCDGVTGVSGGPLFTVGSSGAKLVALTVSEFRSGPGSMQRDAYTHQYANIAISTEDIARTASGLRTALDSGRTPGPFSGVHHLVNLNPNTGDGGGDQGGDGGVDDVDESQRNRVWDNGTQLVNTSVYIQELALGLTTLATQLEEATLRSHADQVASESSEMVSRTQDFVLQPRASGLHFEDMVASQRAFIDAESRLNTYVFPSVGGAVIPSARAVQMVRSIRSARQRLEEITYSR